MTVSILCYRSACSINIQCVQHDWRPWQRTSQFLDSISDTRVIGYYIEEAGE